jgi:2-methylaconitate cis-trans-isomerase PrpF
MVYFEGVTMKPVYLLSAFYKSAADEKRKLAEINTEVRQVSNGDFHVLMMGTGGILIGFTSGLPQEQLTARFSRLGSDTFHYALTQASAMLQGTMDGKSLQWIAAHFPRPRKVT